MPFPDLESSCSSLQIALKRLKSVSSFQIKIDYDMVFWYFDIVDLVSIKVFELRFNSVPLPLRGLILFGILGWTISANIIKG